MPAYCGWLCAAWKIDVFALAICSRIIKVEYFLPDLTCTSCGSNRSSKTCNSVTISVVAIPLATSPALYPPMPSASTTRPWRTSVDTESSLCERTMPGSETLATSRRVERSIMALERYIHVDAAALRFLPHAGLEIGGHFGAGLVTLLDILRQRLVDDVGQAGRQRRVQRAHVFVLLIGDLVHELGHRIA